MFIHSMCIPDFSVILCMCVCVCALMCVGPYVCVYIIYVVCDNMAISYKYIYTQRLKENHHGSNGPISTWAAAELGKH